MKYQLRLRDLQDLQGWLEADNQAHVREQLAVECRELVESPYWRTIEDLLGLLTYNNADLRAVDFVEQVVTWGSEETAEGEIEKMEVREK